MHYDAIVIGGGFYGCSIARHLARSGARHVLLLEANAELMTRASYANQARVHQGYHYPRSLLTALRCQTNFTRFVDQYRDAIVDTFDMYYAIARHQSNVTADQFVRFCHRIGAPIGPPSEAIGRLFNADLIERVFHVREPAFDADVLREQVMQELGAAGVEVRLGAAALAVHDADQGLIVRESTGTGYRTTRVFNCTYSGLNRFLANSGLRTISLKHEIAELALVEVPEPLTRFGVTVMCGPFFSMMPFPSRRLHSLSHVRYTPHAHWHEGPDARADDPDLQLARMPKRSAFTHMMLDARRYVPSMAHCRYVDSLWELKTVLPRSEADDSRPILHHRDGDRDVTCVLGSKIDSVYDVLDEISAGPSIA